MYMIVIDSIMPIGFHAQTFVKDSFFYDSTFQEIFRHERKRQDNAFPKYLNS